MSKASELREKKYQMQKELDQLERAIEKACEEDNLQFLADSLNGAASRGWSVDEYCQKLKSAKTVKIRKSSPRRGVLPDKYSDGINKPWTGKGPEPLWLKKAIANGKTREDFLIK